MLRRYAETRDPALREELVRCFLPLARSLALRYRGAKEPVEDLVQVASLGLVKALDGFEPERGKSFAAYAAPTILGELRRHFRDKVWQVRLPRKLQERTIAVRDAVRKLSDDLGRSPTDSELGELLELSESEVSEAMRADDARRTLCLDVPHSKQDPEALPIAETVGGVEPGYERVEAQLCADKTGLDAHERRVLRLRFHKGLTQSEIGADLGVSQMQVSRIMRGALGKLLADIQASESVHREAA
jgi:RNA polymerase sigma-B factor